MEIITSLENANVKHWNKLTLKKYRDSEGLFLVEGDHLVLEAIKSGNVKEVILNPKKIFPFDIPKHYVNEYVMQKISLMPSIPDVIAVCKKSIEKEIGNKLLLIDALQDPGNLGTIIRSCVAFNIDTIVLGNNTVDLYNEKTIRASEGMLFQVNIIKRDLNTFIEDLKLKEYKIIGTSVEHGTNLKDITLRNKFAIIIGNEGIGVDKKLLEKCDENIYIKMNDTCESLNVGVATGIILYELEGLYNG